MIIAIDGPAGSGKSTVAKLVDLSNIDESKIRTPEVSRAVSLVAKISEVRALAVAKQRAIARDHNIVMEGRDIGSVVFPEAKLKVYLNASVSERANRRHKELLAKGENISFQQIEEDIIRRDEIDQHRANSPLLKLPDAVEIDTTGLSISEVVEQICALK